MDMDYTYNEYFKDDAEAVSDFVKELYQQHVSDLLNPVREMRSRMQKTSTPISDEDLNWILTDLPMNLFTVAESLNQLRLTLEVMKLKKKEIQRDETKRVKEAYRAESGKDPTATYVAEEVSVFMVQHEVLITAYSSTITRIENELSWARELVMGAKKIFDSRRGAESSMPVGEVVDDMPEYVPSKKNVPIR